MENDLNELVTIEQEIEVLKRDEEYCIDLMKQTEELSDWEKLHQLLKAIWVKLDNARDYRYMIEDRINQAIYQ